ncbi:MAG TPA: hypothetical protein PLC22_15300, partial [Gordonia sp. (in: high G+C Gram-positive bacteria)]|nr:hypothetical protein [Gordonia sp. (in: high G+C Gram-positive bacteria)]
MTVALVLGAIALALVVGVAVGALIVRPRLSGGLGRSGGLGLSGVLGSGGSRGVARADAPVPIVRVDA